MYNSSTITTSRAATIHILRGDPVGLVLLLVFPSPPDDDGDDDAVGESFFAATFLMVQTLSCGCRGVFSRRRCCCRCLCRAC